MPSLAMALWLVFAAAADAGAQPGAARTREPGAPSVPKTPATKPVAAPSKPAETNPPRIPVAPSAKSVGASKAPAATEEATFEEPEEEVFSDLRSKGRRKGAHKSAAADRSDPGDRKTTWTPDRYAAVVPPGLTLAALRSQLNKAQPPAEATGPASDQGPGASLADIEKAREALRQETARLEALLKATGNCGGSVGMPIGDGVATPAAVSPAALREAPTEQIDSVSKAMKGMKPEQAAALVARLDRALAAEIMRRMKPADAGAILGLVKPELAAELATQIAVRKSTYGKDKKGSGK